MSLTTKVKVENFSFLNEKSYNKTVITSVNCHFFRKINPYVYLIDVNNCIILILQMMFWTEVNLKTSLSSWQKACIISRSMQLE